MNQQELERRLMTKNEEVMLHGLRGLIRTLVVKEVEDQANEIDFENKASAAVEDAVDDILDDIESKIQEHIDTEGMARHAIRKALHSHDFGPAFADAIRTLIKAGLLDPHIWLPDRRLSWWRRWWREVITFITFKSSSTRPFIG